MSAQKVDDDITSPGHLEEADSPRLVQYLSQKSEA